MEWIHLPWCDVTLIKISVKFSPGCEPNVQLFPCTDTAYQVNINGLTYWRSNISLTHRAINPTRSSLLEGLPQTLGFYSWSGKRLGTRLNITFDLSHITVYYHNNSQTLTWQMVCLLFIGNFTRLLVALQSCWNHTFETMLAALGDPLFFLSL